jgi:hypothetical protein
VERPSTFKLSVNVKTAKALLGLTIPRSLLLRADEVIQVMVARFTRGAPRREP